MVLMSQFTEKWGSEMAEKLVQSAGPWVEVAEIYKVLWVKDAQCSWDFGILQLPQDSYHRKNENTPAARVSGEDGPLGSNGEEEAHSTTYIKENISGAPEISANEQSS